MAVDYDLVILGGSAIARYAALKAARLKARVALIEPETNPIYPLSGATQTTLQTATWHHIGQLTQTLANYHWTTGNDRPHSEPLTSATWQLSQTLGHQVCQDYAETRSLPILAAQGVDVRIGQAQFCRDPKLAVIVKDPGTKPVERSLQARTYLIATSSQSAIPDIPGLSAVPYFTPEMLWQTNWQSPPAKLVILGGEPIAVEIAQTLAQLGSQVILIVEQAQLLPTEDADAAFLIQAQLEATGIQVLTQTSVTQVRQIDRRIWIQAGNQAIETDAFLLAVGRSPQFADLNLAAAGIQAQPHRLLVNAKLQTSNHRIYACGEVLGGYPFTSIAQHEADIALHNALFLPNRRVNYAIVPWAVLTTPQLARVGLTEAQAKQRYGNEVIVLREPLKRSAKAQLQDETTGFCKLITKQNGEILGAHIVGAQASEWIGAIALAMQQRIRIDAIARYPTVFPSFAEVLYHAANTWQQQRLQQRSWLQTGLETWFSLRRSGV
jgi:pyruvate/2-oxoglutarate dehydrogenase complex dihydrolipoamide dehydrogenase (E3) component